MIEIEGLGWCNKRDQLREAVRSFVMHETVDAVLEYPACQTFSSSAADCQPMHLVAAFPNT